ncbi:hypothetical protein PU629_09910 [Pullulanibacillus sp. KACC 23026]|uniref:hypothetical protein n=1 Tax=Pullulanibacillus sp. KACC 23026 TaxID=3028315 RepID=UPI0023B0F315|nr:hypothetical protein [Pullulanibacillus sp. KACC 23026]WEG14648.1 hypothetical protein PU629_09910 [Pullulanibacillus sp. KACC 23026]
MVGLILATLLFNIIAFKTNKKLTTNQIIHIWLFTIAAQNIFDLIIDLKYHGYWYFTKYVDWISLPATVLLVPPANMIFLNLYPFKSSLLKRITFFSSWLFFILIYELIAALPEPWGYFNYGWWKFWYSVLADPFFLLIILIFYKWILKVEKKSFQSF